MPTMTTANPLPLPSFFAAANAERWNYRVNEGQLLAAASAWAKGHGLRPASTDKSKVALLLIDMQKDFCLPDGSLYVGGRSGRGAIDDSVRVAEFMYRNLGQISEVICTLDTHFPFQIFFASFWLDAAGNPPADHTVITTQDIRAGHYRPNPALAAWVAGGNYPWLQRQVDFYCQELERAGKYQLYLWPPHCLLGSDGHALVGVIQEARLFHAYARASRAPIEVKGGHALTENYSVLAPEVLKRHDAAPLAGRNVEFIKTLLENDAIIIAGQAASHCVKSTIEDLLSEIMAQNPQLVKKVYILRDCMSSVAVSDGKGGFVADFTPQAEAALKRFSDAGMNLIDSTNQLELD
jgi:nicotinamidase-related amidase